MGDPGTRFSTASRNATVMNSANTADIGTGDLLAMLFGSPIFPIPKRHRIRIWCFSYSTSAQRNARTSEILIAVAAIRRVRSMTIPSKCDRMASVSSGSQMTLPPRPPLGVPHREVPRLRLPCLSSPFAQAFKRPLLVVRPELSGCFKHGYDIFRRNIVLDIVNCG